MNALTVAENGRLIEYSYDDLVRYHGYGFPGGVAHAFKVMERALPLLAEGGAVERREVQIHTAFPGPGARDAFEMVFRCVTEGRYHVDTGMRAARDTFASANGHYYFEFSYRQRRIAIRIQPGHVLDEFVALGRKKNRTESEEARLTELKQEMSDRLMQLPAEQIYDADRLG